MRVTIIIPFLAAGYLFYLAFSNAEARPGMPGRKSSTARPYPQWLANAWYIFLGLWAVYIAFKYFR
jgi:hypothetical protein